MNNSEEFKNEVYKRAEIKQRQIKLRRRRIAVIVPCIVAVVLTAIFSVGMLDLPIMQSEDKGSAPPEEIYFNDADKNEVKNEIEGYTAADDFQVEAAGNQAQAPNSQSDGAVAQSSNFSETTAGSTPIKSIDYLCIRIFESAAKSEEPYVFAQVIDSPTELKSYFDENKCEGIDSFYNFYVEPFDGMFFIALHVKGYGFKTITQTEEALEIRVERSENEASDGKAHHVMLPLHEKNYDKTKPIEIIKE